ncbi:helix-turn-helix domain-containing protein [Clostridium sp. DL1XJH146]
MVYFSDLLKKVRKDLNMTQEQLARELHVSFSTVNRWENDKSNPSNIAKVLFYSFCKEKGITIEQNEVI